MTPRLLRQLAEKGMEEQLVADEELIGRYVANDIVNVETGESLRRSRGRDRRRDT